MPLKENEEHLINATFQVTAKIPFWATSTKDRDLMLKQIQRELKGILDERGSYLTVYSLADNGEPGCTREAKYQIKLIEATQY